MAEQDKIFQIQRLSELNTDNWILGNHVHVWKIPAIEGSFSLLTDEERAFANKFYFQEDRLRYSVGRQGLRMLLSKYLLVDPSSIFINSEPRQKPTINRQPSTVNRQPSTVIGHRSSNNTQPLANINFNVSHSGEWVLIAIAENEVGIDIERINREFSYEDLLGDHFSEAEQTFILQSEDPVQSFYYLWTRKEALTKAWGTGLQENLKRVDVLHSVNRQPSTVNPPLSTVIGHRSSVIDQQWKLSSLDIAENYSAAIAYSVHADQVILRPLKED